MSQEEVLQVISQETKNSLSDFNIVTPAIYSSMFAKFAHAHQAEIVNDEKISSDILDQKFLQLTRLQEETSKNAHRLSDNTNKAISAIKDKNDSLLQEVLEETNQLRAEIEKLKETLYKDELTNVYNRKWLNDNYITESNMNNDGILALIDLNYFKMVNDTYGHVIGDKVLVFVAQQLKTTHGQVIRYGGDEFIILFDAKVGKKEVNRRLDQLRESVIHKSLKVKDKSFKTSFSYGVTTFDKATSLEHVLEQADQKMYDDKIAIKKRIKGI